MASTPWGCREMSSSPSGLQLLATAKVRAPSLGTTVTALRARAWPDAAFLEIPEEGSNDEHGHQSQADPLDRPAPRLEGEILGELEIPGAALPGRPLKSIRPSLAKRCRLLSYRTQGGVQGGGAATGAAPSAGQGGDDVDQHEREQRDQQDHHDRSSPPVHDPRVGLEARRALHAHHDALGTAVPSSGGSSADRSQPG